MNLMVDLAGWVGAVVLLATYAMLSFHYISSSRPAYHVANIAGAVLLAVNTAFHGAYPSTIVNVVWIAIGVMAMLGKKKVMEPSAD